MRYSLIENLFGKTDQWCHEIFNKNNVTFNHILSCFTKFNSSLGISISMMRDLIRILSIEYKFNCYCYTVNDNANESSCASSRHITSNFCNRRFCRNLLKKYGEEIKFDEITLDYFYIPSTQWQQQHWTSTFFSTTLSDIYNEGLLNQHGNIFLPFTPYILENIISHHENLSSTYNIEFVCKTNLGMNVLWQGTQMIPSETYATYFGKDKHQEELYCKHSINKIKNLISKSVILEEILKNIEDVSKVRMIKLYPTTTFKISTKPKSSFISEENNKKENNLKIQNYLNVNDTNNIITNDYKRSDYDNNNSSDIIENEKKCIIYTQQKTSLQTKRHYFYQNCLKFKDKLFKFHPVDGNGNCFFSSLLKHKQLSHFDTSYNLRKEIVDSIRRHVENNTDIGTNIMILYNQYKKSDTDINDHLNNMQKDGTWAGVFETFCVQLLFELNISTYQNSNNGIIDTFPHSRWSNARITKPSTKNGIVHLYFHQFDVPWNTESKNYNHYTFLEHVDTLSCIYSPFEGGTKYVCKIGENKDNNRKENYNVVDLFSSPSNSPSKLESSINFFDSSVCNEDMSMSEAKENLCNNNKCISTENRCQLLQEQLNKIGFTIFLCQKDFGLYHWIINENDDETEIQNISNSTDITKYINLCKNDDGPYIVPIKSLTLPFHFSNTNRYKSITHNNEFPYGNRSIGSLYVGIQVSSQ